MSKPVKILLTHAGNYCEDIALCDPRNSTCGGSCRGKQLWDRLKAYEDTGLTPEEVHALLRRLAGTDREHSGLIEED